MLRQLLSFLSTAPRPPPPPTTRGASLDAPIFLSEMHRQVGYDREIDEGMSAGLVRMLTLDVTAVPGEELGRVVEGLRKGCADFAMCKQVQLAGFNTGGRRYLAVSGEMHLFHQGGAVDAFAGQVKSVTSGSAAVVVGHVTPPSTRPRARDSYESVNLGPYGTTGTPTQQAHSWASEWRARGMIE